MADKVLKAAYVLDSSGVSRGRKQAEKEMGGVNASAKKMSDEFDRQTSRMGGALSGLSGTLAGFGVPFTGALDKIGGHLDDAKTKGTGYGQVLSDVGKVATVGMAAGLATAGAESVHLAESFQQSTANMAAQADIPIGAANRIGDAFLGTAGKSTFSAQQIEAAFGPVAGQLGEVEGHALSASEALAVMNAATALAEATGTDLGSSTHALAATMQAYNLKASDAATVSNVLFNVARQTGNGVDAVATAAQRLKMRLGDATPPLSDIGGLMVEMAGQGVVGSRSVNMVGSALSGLVYPSSTAQKTLDEMGIKLTDAKGKFIGLGPSLDAVKKGLETLPGANQAAAATQQLAADKARLAQLALEKQTPAVKAQVAAIKQHDLELNQQVSALSQSGAAYNLFGKNASTLIPIVLEGSAALDKQAASVGRAGSAHAAAEKQTQTLHAETEKMKSEAVDYGTKLGEVLIPKVETLMSDTAKTVEWFTKHKDAAYALAAVIGGPLALAVGAFAVNKIAGMVKGMQDAVTNLGNFASKAGDVASTVAQKFGLIGQSADGMNKSVAQSAEQMATQTESSVAGMESSTQMSFAGMEASATGSAATMETGVAGDAAGMATKTEASVTGMSTAVEGDFTGLATAVEATTGGMEATVDTEMATATATVSTDTAAMKADSAAAMGSLSKLLGLVGTVATVGVFADKMISQSAQHQSNIDATIAGIEKNGQNLSSQQIAQMILNASGAESAGPFPGRAGGGPVSAGQFYVVGENGPELFVSGASGAVIPPSSGTPVAASAGGGRGGIELHVHIESGGLLFGSPQDIANHLAPSVRTALRSLAQVNGTSNLTV